MSFKTRNVERIAGLFVITVVISIIILFVFVGNEKEWFAERYTLKAVFEHGGNLQQDTVVAMEGVNIGKVQKISFNDQNKVEVLLSIKSRYSQQIRKDSYATLVRPALIGDSVLEISFGNPKQPVLEDGGILQVREAPETTMKDILAVSNNLVQVLKDFANPQGSYQKILKNLENVTGRLDKADSSLWAMCADDGQMYRDSKEILSYLNEYIKKNNAIPIELSKRSELIVNLSAKLDKQMEQFSSLTEKLDVISRKIVNNEGMAGAIVSDKELYTELLKFMRDSKVLLDSLNQLASEMKLVIPKLLPLIDSAKRGTKDMEEVMDVLKRMPIIRQGVRKEEVEVPIEVEGRIERDQSQQ